MIRRLAIIGTRGIPARYGGFETFAEQISWRLVEQGVKVTVYCEKDGNAEQLADYRGVKLEYVSSPSLGPFTTILFDLICLWKARKSFDMVYMLGYGASLFCFLPRLWGTEVWINMDGVEWARSKWSSIAKLWFRIMEVLAMWTPNRVICDAEAIRVHLKSRHRRLPSCSVIPYGAPVIDSAPPASLLDEWGLKPNGYYLAVCRLEPENHVREIIEGHRAADSQLPLVIVGNHACGTGYIKSLLSSADKRTCFIGGIYKQEKLLALRWHCLAYFHGHSAGGTNPSLLEALGCGNAIIAHDNVFNREVARGAAMYFKNHRDIPQLLIELESDHDKRRQLGDKARGVIRKHYTWDKITQCYMALLR